MDGQGGELGYYRRLADELGAKVLKLQDELRQSRSELERSRVLSRIVRKGYVLGCGVESERELARRYLAMSASELGLTRAVFYRFHPAQDAFACVAASGISCRHIPPLVPPPDLGEFHMASVERLPGPLEVTLREIIGAECFLWCWSRERDVALLMGGCVTGTRRHCHLGPNDREVLEGALGILLDILDRRRAERSAEEVQRFLAEVLDALPDPLVVKDAEHRWLFVNQAFCHLMQRARASLTGKTDHDVYPPGEAERVWLHDDAVFASATEEVAQECFTDSQGRARYLSTKKALVRATDGGDTVLVASSRDITGLKEAEARISESLREKELLLREIHHRVKNNMQVISSLLTLQVEQLFDPRDAEILRESQNRVRAMAFIHDRLYRAENLDRVDFRDYVKNLGEHLLRTYGIPDGRIKLDNAVDGLSLSIDQAIPSGLAVNELLCNAVKHAFPAGRAGRISVSLARDGNGGVTLAVSDDGVGLPPGFDHASCGGLGLRLVSSLARQLRGELAVGNGGGNLGASFSIRFSLD